MIIQNSNINMNSKRSYEKTEATYTALNVWGGVKSTNNAMGIFGTPKEQEGASGEDAFTGSFNNSMDDVYKRYQETSRVSSPQISDVRANFRKMQEDTIQYLLRLLFGDKYGVLDKSSDAAFVDSAQQTFGGHYEQTYFYEESESTSFQTTGVAKTADGREIEFNVNLTMTRRFMEYSHTSIDFGAPQLTDPLVINLGSGAASVSDQTFLFDIDADGTLDTISMLGPGSGYLALDKNGDGIINDGSELFGTRSGNGFADLAAYDLDGNGWIDEADEIFDKLRIWSKDANGKDVLVGLGQAGVGAIYLGYSDTEFSLNSLKDNSTNAVIRQTGIFLYESGKAGTVQQMDVAKQFAASS